jgi:hypothetical protein
MDFDKVRIWEISDLFHEGGWVSQVKTWTSLGSNYMGDNRIYHVLTAVKKCEINVYLINDVRVQWQLLKFRCKISKWSRNLVEINWWRLKTQTLLWEVWLWFIFDLLLDGFARCWCGFSTAFARPRVDEPPRLLRWSLIFPKLASDASEQPRLGQYLA